MSSDYQVIGRNTAALFTLKLHRGDGMTLVAMNWKNGKPPRDFVGFAIEYKEPGGDRFYALKNRLAFPAPGDTVDPTRYSTMRSPIQKFRWVHFPRNAEMAGEFVYRVTPVFMNGFDELSYGDAQEAAIELRRETYPEQLNIAFTRGFVSSQAFVDRYVSMARRSGRRSADPPTSTWRGFFVQANSAVVLRGKAAIKPFLAAFDAYWQHDRAAGFGKTASAEWTALGLEAIDARVAFSPHAKGNALLAAIAADIEKTKSSLFYSLAFLYQTPGPIQDAIANVTHRDDLFVYGISDRKVHGRLSGLDLQKPDGKVSPVRPAALTGKVPEPFKSEPTGLAGGVGNRMHHKFVVIDFDKPSARVYLGSYNFSNPADTQNGENLLLFRDRRIAVSYTIEALRLFDHYHFRVVQEEAKKGKRRLNLAPAPRSAQDKPWWDEDYTNARKIRDRELFA